MLAELRALVPEAEAWARAEGDAAGAAPLRRNFGRRRKEWAEPTRNGGSHGSRAPPSASQRSPCERGSACGNAGDRAREPEGRRREDDDDAEPRRRVRGAGLQGAADRPRPAGQPDDVAGPEPGHDRAVDVRRARPPPADRAGDRDARGRHRRLVDRPRRRRHGAVEPDRPRARAREGARAGQATTTTSSSSTRRRRSAC